MGGGQELPFHIPRLQRRDNRDSWVRHRPRGCPATGQVFSFATAVIAG